MDLLLNNLINSHILIPAKNSGDSLHQSEVHQIAVFEPAEDTFFDTIKQPALVFFPRGTGRFLKREQIGRLEELACALVFYPDDPLPSLSPGQGPLLFLLPPQTCISQTIAGCYHLAYSSIQKLAEASLETMEKLSREVLQHKGENEHIIKIAIDLMECPVAFATSDFHLQKAPTIPREYLVQTPLCTEDTFDWDLALESFQVKTASLHPCLAEGINGARISGYLHQNKYCREQSCRIFIFPITDASNCYGYLFLSLDAREGTLSPEKSIKIQQLLAILKFEIIKSDEIAHTVNRYYDFLLDELIESDQTDFRKLMQKYGLVQKVIYDQYYVMIAGRSPRSTSDTSFHELLTSQQFNLLYDQMVGVLGTINFFLFERKDYLVALLPDQLIEAAPEGFSPVISLFRQFLEEQYQGVGISEMVSTRKVRQGYLQALKALAVSQRSLEKAPCSYGELGILRFFFDHSDHVDFAPLLQIYQEYILPVIQYDQQHGSELLTTLTAYISCCSSPSAICSALFIHKNTLYSRLNKISQVLGKSLSDSEAIFNISLGLKIQTLIQAGILQGELDP